MNGLLDEVGRKEVVIELYSRWEESFTDVCDFFRGIWERDKL